MEFCARLGSRENAAHAYPDKSQQAGGLHPAA
jgi:hypothetical protein